jgi:hypothetical protein
LELQAGNTSGETITIKSEIIAGNEIASFVDSNPIYEIQEMGSAPVNVKITIPENTNIGSEYIVTYKFSDVTPSVGSGTVVFKGAFEVSMKVLVISAPVEEEQIELVPKTNNGTVLWLIIGIILVIAILIIIYLIIREKNKSNKFKK